VALVPVAGIGDEIEQAEVLTLEHPESARDWFSFHTQDREQAWRGDQLDNPTMLVALLE